MYPTNMYVSSIQVKRETQGLLSTDARAGLFARIVDDLAAHAAFTAAVLPTASGVLSAAAAARRTALSKSGTDSLASPLPARSEDTDTHSPLAKLKGVSELLQLVAAFAGVPTGRHLRNAREFVALVRPLLDGKAKSVDSEVIANASLNSGSESGATTSHSTSSSSTASTVSDESTARPIVRRRVFDSGDSNSESISGINAPSTRPPLQATISNDRRRRSTRNSNGPTSLWVTPYVATPGGTAEAQPRASALDNACTSDTGLGTPVAGKNNEHARVYDLDSATPASSAAASEPSPSMTPTSLILPNLACAGSDGSSGSWGAWSNKKRKNRAWACASPL